MRNEFSSSFTLGNGLNSATSLSVTQTEYRIQDRRDDSKIFSTTLMMPFGFGLLANVGLSDNRTFNRIVTFSGALQDFTNNIQQGQAGLKYLRVFNNGLALDGQTSALILSSEKSYKQDEDIQGSIQAGVGYTIWDRVRVSGRGYLRKSSQDSQTGLQRAEGLGADEDSLYYRMRVNLIEGTNVEVSYTRYSLTQETMTLPRGVFSEVQLESEELIREIETKESSVWSIAGQMKPLSSVTIEMTATHNEDLNDFAVVKKRFSRNVGDLIRGRVTYSLGPKTNMSMRLENREVLRDLGPLSVGSYRDERKAVDVGLQHTFSTGLGVNLQAAVGLQQSFYLDFETNPRDRDQLDQSVSLRISSKPFPKFSTQIDASVSSTDYVNIAENFSRNNRGETTYDLRPQITYQLNPRLSITQVYGLNIEFTDFVFTEDDNFLDRNITFSNQVKATLTNQLQVELYYSLLLHDRGSYLRPRPGAERLLDISQEDRRDQMRIGFRYGVNRHLALIGKNEYSQRREQFVGSDRETVFTDGGVEIGVEGNYGEREGRKLSFRLKRVNRFGRFIAEAQKDYWVMDSSIQYSF